MSLTGPQLRAQLADQARNPRRQVAGTGLSSPPESPPPEGDGFYGVDDG
jgi:hypothetical protein